LRDFTPFQATPRTCGSWKLNVLSLTDVRKR